MAPLILKYDSECPLCNSFAKLLKRKLAGEAVLLEAMAATEAKHATEFELVTPQKTLLGKEAVEYLAEEFPQIKDIFWMLPDSYKTRAVIKSYSLAQKFRRRWRRNCDC
ncbi:MAG: hypothetical protein GX801_01400 [Fibrobacter sp.]|nr:hypothetical protein [Fibrobacter sp.]